MTTSNDIFNSVTEIEARCLYAEYLEDKSTPLMSFAEFCIYEGYFEAEAEDDEYTYPADELSQKKAHGTLFENRNRRIGS